MDVPGAEVIPARDYLTDSRFLSMRHAKVFNLCTSYAYQSVGYYVSLLAAARRHKPLPSVATIQDLRQSAVLRIVSEELEQLLQKVLAPIKADRFELSIYFGHNLAAKYDRLCHALFAHFPAPLMRAEFVHVDQWRLNALKPIASSDIPDSHREFVIEQAQRFFARPRISDPSRARYDIAILTNPGEVDCPSDKKAIARFVRAAKNLDMRAFIISKQDYGRIAEYDALFIRETTSVNHHTYRFARRAEAEGLVVIDDSESIIRCSNKVYQAELFEKNGIPCPKTLIVHKDNAKDVGKALGFPCVLKRPDSSFSVGVEKARDEAQLAERLAALFQKSELIVAQEFMPSSFDWRIGVLNGKALYACKYHMARGHWQVQKAPGEHDRYGRTETMRIEDAPEKVAQLAVRAANLIGRGLYGVDIKEVEGRFVVIEINDNPSIDSGGEDAILKDDLYEAVMRTFLERLDARGQPLVGPP
jgi:glutathione synthase/RimK-type ligase-like ATP-grasp enzyme